MREPRKDDERLSALLQGQVSGPERDELLAHLAASDDDYEVFNDAVEILGALEAEDAGGEAPTEPATVIPMDQPRRPWRPPARWVALAAVLAGVALVSPRVLRERRPAGGDPVQLAAAVHPREQQLPPGWPGEAPWAVGRGGGSPSAPREAQAAQAGARMVQLSMAVRARNTKATHDLARQVSSRFEAEEGGATPLRQIAERPDAPPKVLEDLLELATSKLADNLDPDYLELGAWAEAARVAAFRHNEPFFRGASSRKMLRRAEQLTREDSTARTALGQVRGALPAEGTPNWDALGASLNTLLREIAS